MCYEVNKKVGLVVDNGKWTVDNWRQEYNGGADYLITHNKDFNILKQTDFPKINTVRLDEFKEIQF